MMTSPAAGSARLIDPLRKALERLPFVAPGAARPRRAAAARPHRRRRRRAIAAAIAGEGAPGVYNLAAPDELTISDIARELGWASVPIPQRRDRPPRRRRSSARR